MKQIILTFIFCLSIIRGGFAMDKKIEIATLAGGCFWCLDHTLEKVDGIQKVIVGYAGGAEDTADYKTVSKGDTSHREAAQVYFDPDVITYSAVLDIFWENIDPTDPGGSFDDRGFQYTSAVYAHDPLQRQQALAHLCRRQWRQGDFRASRIYPYRFVGYG